jgi:drug/metabolite transporter (DMT)-like permease
MRTRMTADRILPAIGLRLTSVACFALMNAGIKLAEARGAGLGEILFFRQAGAAVVVTAVIAAGPGLASVRTRRFGAHVGRCALGLTGMAFTFAAILMLPLAEATIIGFTVPIFATILGALVLREPTGAWRWGAVLAGFAGVLIVVQPGPNSHFPLLGAACGLLAAFLTANITILLRTIGRTEAALTTVFWFSVLSLVPLGIVYAFAARPHDALAWAILCGIGVAGGLAQIAMTTSLRLAPVGVVVPMDYSSLLWATLLGWLAFGTLPAAATWTGAPVIVAAGLVIVWREARLRKRPAAVQAVSDD